MNKINLLTQVKSYLNKADNTRPILRTIQHKNNHQFICNGYSLFVFNKHIESLDMLPQTIDELSINYKFLLNYNKGNFETITPEYKFVFENLKKYMGVENLFYVEDDQIVEKIIELFGAVR